MNLDKQSNYEKENVPNNILATRLLYAGLITGIIGTTPAKTDLLESIRVSGFNDSKIEKQAGIALYVTSDNLNVRLNTDISSKTLFKLSQGEKIKIIDTVIINGFIWKKIRVLENDYFLAYKNLKTGKKYLSTDFESKVEITKGYSVKIDKSDRKLKVFNNGELEKEFNMAISGYEDNQPKMMEGDMRTPEGKYFVSYKNKVSSFGTNPETGRRLGSLLVSYPNINDAWNGLNKGIIDINEYNTIYHSIKTKGVPPQTTNLGSRIMIHGGGSTGDWTAGCIALDNVDMLWMNRNIKSGVNIEIVK